METSKTIQPNLVEFPEETTQEGVRLYGTASMDNCLAVLTHYAHNAEDSWIVRQETIAPQPDGGLPHHGQ